MKFHILTLFPEMIEQGLNTSIIGKAIEKDIISLNTYNIRDFTTNKHKKVDDYPYGGGAGMLMQAQPVYDAFCAVKETCRTGKSPRVIFLSPQGTPFHQGLAKELATEDHLIMLCGHYEGIDQRVLDEIVTDYISLGDYVLTGGELAAMVVVVRRWAGPQFRRLRCCACCGNLAGAALAVGHRRRAGGIGGATR